MEAAWQAVRSASTHAASISSPTTVLAVILAAALLHVSIGSGNPATSTARRMLRLQEELRSKSLDASEVTDIDSARAELARLRRELYFIGDCSVLQLTVGWAPWGATVMFIVGIFRGILDLLEGLGGTAMFRILVNLELRTFCSRAGLEYNYYELAAKRGVANFNEQRSFSWRVMEPDGSSHDQRIMAVGCEHGEMWLKVSNAWAKIYLQWWLPRVPVCGIVVFLHDYGSYSGEVAQVLPHFLSRGLAVVSYDVRGHGRSSGIHGLLPPLSALAEDLQLVLEMVATLDVSRYSANAGSSRPNNAEPPPLFLYGNGLGGLQALFYAATLGQDSDIKGIVVQAPLLSLDQPYAHYERSSLGIVGNIVGRLFPAWPLSDWHGNQSTLTQEQVDKVQSDIMRYHGKLRAGTAKNLADGVADLSRILHQVTLPVFMQQGASDVSKLLHSQSILRGLSSEDKQLVTYKTSSHLFMIESPVLLSSITEEALDWVDATGGQRSGEPRRFVQSASPFDDKPRRRRRRIKDRMLRANKTREERDRLPSLEPDGAITMAPSEDANISNSGPPSSRGSRMYRRFRGMWGTKSAMEVPPPNNTNQDEDFISDGDNSGDDFDATFNNTSREFGGTGNSEGIVFQGGDANDLPESAASLEAHDPRFSVNDQYRNALPPLEEWPDRPVIVRCSDDVPMEVHIPGKSAYGALPINDKTTPIPFETPLFKGVAMIRIADLPSSPADYFSGKRRKMQVAVQGKFKKRIRFDNVFSGQEFVKPLRNIPGRWLINWALGLLRSRLPGTFKCDAFAPKPFFLSPLISTSQAVRADRGTPQDVTDGEIFEENRDFGSAFRKKEGESMSSTKRKKFFVDVATLQQYYFDPEVTYTFDYYQQFFRAGLFALDVGVKLIDLGYYVGKQPLLLTMAKTMDTNEYLWKFELFHEKLLSMPDD